MMELRYEEVPERSRSQLERELHSDDPAVIASALYSATYHDPDWRWVEGNCLRLAEHPDSRVRLAVAICLGDLAVFHDQIDFDLVLPRLKQMLSDPEIAGQVQDSIDMVENRLKL